MANSTEGLKELFPEEEEQVKNVPVHQLTETVPQEKIDEFLSGLDEPTPEYATDINIRAAENKFRDVNRALEPIASTIPTIVKSAAISAANILNIPTDVYNLALDLMSLTSGQTGPLFQLLKSQVSPGDELFERIGVNIPELRKGQTGVGRFVSTSFENILLGLLPVSLLAQQGKALAQAGKDVPKVYQAAMALMRNPGMFISGEIGAAAGATAAEQAIDNISKDELMKFFGIKPGTPKEAALSSIVDFGLLFASTMAGEASARKSFGFATRSNMAKEKLKEQLLQTIPNPSEEAKQIKKNVEELKAAGIENPPTLAVSGSDIPQRMAKSLAQQEPKLSQRITESVNEFEEQFLRSIAGTTRGSVIENALPNEQELRTALTKANVELVRASRTDAMQALNTQKQALLENLKRLVFTEGNEPEISRKITNITKGAYNIARSEQTKLWQEVKNVSVTINNSIEAIKLFEDVDDELLKLRIPRKFNLIIGNIKDGKFNPSKLVNANSNTISISQLQSLRSDLLKQLQETKDEKTRYVIRNLANAVLKDMLDGQTYGDVTDALDTARNFTREMHNTFEQSSIASILNLKTNEETLALKKLKAFVGGDEGGLAALDAQIKQLEQFMNSSPSMQKELAGKISESPDFKQFVTAAIKSKFYEIISANPDNGTLFLASKNSLLNKMPELKQHLSNSLKKRIEIEETLRHIKETDPRFTLSDEFLGLSRSPIGGAISFILKSPNPDKMIDAISSTAKVPKRTIKEMVAYDLFSRGKTINGIKDLIDKPQYRALMQKIFDEDELNRINKLIDIAATRSGLSNLPVNIQKTVNPSSLDALFVDLISLNLGSSLGSFTGAQLKTASAMQRFVRSIHNFVSYGPIFEVATEFVLNPHLATILLEDASTMKGQARIRKAVASLMATTRLGNELRKGDQKEEDRKRAEVEDSSLMGSFFNNISRSIPQAP